jgi:type VI protein secretion system component Hcp
MQACYLSISCKYNSHISGTCLQETYFNNNPIAIYAWEKEREIHRLLATGKKHQSAKE